MVTVSDNFKVAMKQPVKEIKAFIKYDEIVTNDSGDTIYNKIEIADSDDLISYKISCDSGLCKSAMRKLEANYFGSHNLLDKWVTVGFGVRLPDGDFDLIDYGTFLVTELTETKDTETTSIVAYDKMVNAMTPYQKLDVEYPIDLYTYTQKLCEACSLELGNVSFGESPSINIDNSMWELHGANRKDDGSLEVFFDSNINTGIDWNKIDSTLYVQFTLVSGGYYRCHIQCYDEDGSTLGSIENRSTGSIENNSLLTIRFDGVPEDTRHITLRFYNTYEAEVPYTISNVSVYQPNNLMDGWQITQELWATYDETQNVWVNNEGITYRDIFQQIAQATASTCIIHDEKVYFKPLTDTGEDLTYDNLFKLKLEALYGEINSVVLSRTPAEDNIYMRNEASVQTNGVTEFKIENNQIIDKDRENALEPIFNALNGISYYPFEATTEGLGWYEIGDNITIVNDLGDEFKTSLFNYTITVDGSVKETLKTTAESKTQTQYQYATTVAKQLKNTEFIVNKQENYIKSIVADSTERFTTIEQDVEKINFNIQNSVGNNLIKNSVMFAYGNENEPTNWTVEGNGTLTIVSDVEFQKSGGISCHGFILSNKTVKTEEIAVKPFDENNPIYYSFSTKIKKDSEGTCYVKIYNPDIEEDTHIISLQEGETSNLEDHEITALMPMGDRYIIEFYGDSNVTFTDNMFAIGEQKSQWTQANGEVMNTQVNFSSNGIMVRNTNEEGENTGDYTVISPLEFAGYSKIDSGSPKQVFTLNKGVTEVNKLKAENEISMPPLKIVPITEGDMQGWAFVLA